MNQKITCPHCKKEFPMEEGLVSHLKTLEMPRKKEKDKRGSAKTQRRSFNQKL